MTQKTSNTCWQVLVLLTALSFTMSNARARGFGGSESGEDSRILSTAGGIASPSVTAGLNAENPAGLAINSKFKFMVEGSGGSTLNPLGFGGRMYLGNGSVGTGIGLDTSMGSNVTPGQYLALNYGLAATIEAIKMAFGFTGQYVLNSTAGAPAGTANGIGAVDLGILFNPQDKFRVGFTAYGVVGGVDSWGAGLAYDVAPAATIAVDATANPNSFSNMTIKPGMSLHLQPIQISAGYGIAMNSGGGRINTGADLGIGIEVGKNCNLQGYYNHYSTWFFGLTIRTN